jgi:hypothetical protein
MPNLSVFQPPANLPVQLNQPFLVTGQASDKGSPESILIDSVTVQVDDGPVIDAALTQIHDKKISLFSFKAFAQVTGGQDPHTVTVTGSSDILGTGTATIEARDQTMVDMSVTGSDHIRGYQQDLAGGAGQTYGFALINISPDPDKFNWQVSGTGSIGGSIGRNPFDQSGNISVVFPLPQKVKPGTSPFALAVSATETCGSDTSKTLTASTSMDVKVEVLPDPNVPP